MASTSGPQTRKPASMPASAMKQETNTSAKFCNAVFIAAICAPPRAFCRVSPDCTNNLHITARSIGHFPPE